MTDGRASKSFIRHLKRRWERFKHKSQMRSELTAKEELSNHLDIVDLSESVLAPTKPVTGVLSSLICLSTTWSLSPWTQVQTSSVLVQRPIRDVQCLPIGDVTL